MTMVNRMSSLLDKIERRLAVRYIIEKDDRLSKDAWADVIMQETMDTFSRYFPNREIVVLTEENCRYDIDGIYIINEELLDGLDIIGFGDIDWTNIHTQNRYNTYGSGGVYDMYATPMSIYDVGLVQSAANVNSIFNSGIFVKFMEPNKIQITGINNRDLLRTYKRLPINVFVKHKNLTTVAATKMEMFEKLACCDVAKYLIGELKYFDGYDTNYGQIDLKLDDLREEANKRESLLDEFDAQYVNPANKYQPIIMTI